MSEIGNPRGSQRPHVSGTDMADALADVMKDQGKKTQDRRSPPRKKKTSPFTWFLFLVCGPLAAYIWVVSPSWLEPETPVLSPALAEAGLRMEVFHQALMVEEFRETRGRLPDDLPEAGVPASEIEYERISSQDYRLRFAGGMGEVEYVSTQSLDAFLGSSLQVIEGGG